MKKSMPIEGFFSNFRNIRYVVRREYFDANKSICVSHVVRYDSNAFGTASIAHCIHR